MKSMTISEFCAPDTHELRAFKAHWYDSIYPKLSEEDKHFYDYSANVWDWADQYEIWKPGK